jgi:bifunctional UDP-N-acetylglucosamine pyrophosphorylase/glucosamine-1-phosphate N-acetyltransferase
MKDHCRIGPFAHLRSGVFLQNRVQIGNFVEMKNSSVGRATKALHLSYIGDAQVGKGVNVGAGTITCNFDGYHKNTTIIEDGVFLGSDSQMIAPVHIGKGAFIAAGSTITADVPAHALAIARVRQVNKADWCKKRSAQKKLNP